MSLKGSWKTVETPGQIFLLPLLPTTPNDRHPSCGRRARNQRVPFVLVHLCKGFLFLPVTCFHGPSARSGMWGVLPGQPSLFWMPARCWKPPRIPNYTHPHPHTPLPAGFWGTNQQESTTQFEAVSLTGQFVTQQWNNVVFSNRRAGEALKKIFGSAKCSTNVLEEFQRAMVIPVWEYTRNCLLLQWIQNHQLWGWCFQCKWPEYGHLHSAKAV